MSKRRKKDSFFHLTDEERENISYVDGDMYQAAKGKKPKGKQKRKARGHKKAFYDQTRKSGLNDKLDGRDELGVTNSTDAN